MAPIVARPSREMSALRITLTLLLAAFVAGACRPAPPGEAPTASPTAPATPGTVATWLSATLDAVCPSDGTTQRETHEEGHLHTLVCAQPEGHSVTVTVETFGDFGAARVAFDEARGNNAVEVFHGAPSVSWHEDHPSLPGGRAEIHVWLWQAGEHLVRVESYDETAQEVMPAQETIVEVLHSLGLEQGLLQR